MTVQPMQRIDDPIATIEFKEIRRTTLNEDRVANAKILYTLNFVNRQSNDYIINSALKDWTLYDIKIEKQYYDIDSLWIEVFGNDK